MPKICLLLPPEAVKELMDAGRRSTISFLGKEVKGRNLLLVVAADITIGFVIGNIHHFYKKWYERPEPPNPAGTRTWYGV